MKLSSALAAVVLSLPLMSCVTDDVIIAPGSAAGAGVPGTAVTPAVADLMAAHHDYLAHVRNTGQPGLPHSCSN